MRSKMREREVITVRCENAVIEIHISIKEHGEDNVGQGRLPMEVTF